ncbi:hypothetical protein ACFSFW_22880 [Fredinandcohnia salidurans]|jgi:hypothetical protein|uniref:Uncharacterized protein n=1 Tax=Fredinandcohnia salidurans TaxID=2595041 RepID=A0ABW4MV51_9BACI
MNLAALLIALFFFIALLIAVLLGTPEQRNIVINCINEILGTIA